MLKTDVFVWLTVNCKSLNFCSVDTLSAQLHCHMGYLFIATTRTVHTSRTAVLHAILSFLISLFAVYYSQSHKILQFYWFQILLSKKVGGGGMAPLAPWVFFPCISVAKTVSKKIGTMICSTKFLSSVVALYLYKSTIPTCMDTFVMSVLVLLVTTWSCYISYRKRYVGLLILHLLPLLNSWLIVEMLPA